jgi:toxin YoeB
MIRAYFDEPAAMQFRDWLTDSPRTAVKIFDLIRAIEQSPFEGIGKPERLKHNLKGLWSRRITQEHRLVYKVEEDAIIILSCHGHYE